MSNHINNPNNINKLNKYLDNYGVAYIHRPYFNMRRGSQIYEVTRVPPEDGERIYQLRNLNKPEFSVESAPLSMQDDVWTTSEEDLDVIVQGFYVSKTNPLVRMPSKGAGRKRTIKKTKKTHRRKSSMNRNKK
jgi:hypothetical protein